MADLRTIMQQIQFLLTAVTWCCVLLLNNQEITTYYPAPQHPTSEASSHLQKTASRKEQTVVKQKVIFEATTSYFILPLAFFTHWLQPALYVSPRNVPEPLLKASQVRHFFSVLFASIIVPNGP